MWLGRVSVNTTKSGFSVNQYGPMRPKHVAVGNKIQSVKYWLIETPFLLCWRIPYLSICLWHTTGCTLWKFASFAYFIELEFELVLLYFLQSLYGSFMDYLGLTARVPFLTGAEHTSIPYLGPFQLSSTEYQRYLLAGKARTHEDLKVGEA
jgi:hypothetical protein